MGSGLGATNRAVTAPYDFGGWPLLGLEDVLTGGCSEMCLGGSSVIICAGGFLSVLSIDNGIFGDQESTSSPVSEILRFFLVVVSESITRGCLQRFQSDPSLLCWRA